MPTRPNADILLTPPTAEETAILARAVVAAQGGPAALTTLRFAAGLEVREDMIDVAQSFADGAMDLASIDFARNGYLGTVPPQRLAALHAAALDESWAQVNDDLELAGRWSALENSRWGAWAEELRTFIETGALSTPAGQTPRRLPLERIRLCLLRALRRLWHPTATLKQPSRFVELFRPIWCPPPDPIDLVPYECFSAARACPGSATQRDRSRER